MSNAATVQTTAAPAVQPPVKESADPIGVFTKYGRYNDFAKEQYQDAMRILHYPSEVADKLARAMAKDISFLNRAQAKVKLGAHKKADDTLTLREVAEMKGIVLTNALRIGKLMKALQECVKWGMRFDKSDIDVSDDVESWLFQ